MNYITITIAMLLSVIAGLIYIPGIVIISKRKNLYDEAGGRKPHKGNIPRTAGLTFFPTFILSYSVSFIIAELTGSWNWINMQKDNAEIGMLLAGLSLLFMMGFVDDLIGVSWRRKFLVQFLAALMPVIAGLNITNLDGLFGIYELPPIVGCILTVFVVILLVNAYNLIDGIDGLCSSISFYAIILLGTWFYVHNITRYALASASIAGITAVYFYYNTTHTRFRTFMGDTGSTNLAYIIAFLALAFYNNNVEDPNIDWHPLSILFGLTSLPLLDTVRVFTVRILKGLSPFHADKRHIHHKLLELGLTHIRCTLICFVLQGCSFILNYFLRDINVNIILITNILFMLLYTGIIDYLVAKRIRKIDKNGIRYNIKNNMISNSKTDDKTKILSYIRSHGTDSVSVQDIIDLSGAHFMRIYPILFEMEEEGIIDVVQREEMGSPRYVKIKSSI